MKILLLGHTGQLGQCLIDKLENSNNEVIYFNREQLNISDLDGTSSKIKAISPNLIINASAYTAVDMAEENQKTANIINNIAVSNIADICKKLGCWLIHISTDYVFDGKSDFPYKEDDKTNPQSIYGKTKLNGELAIQSSNCNYIIIRTAWLFSEYGNNFLKSMLKLGATKNELKIIGDQFGCPTYAMDLAGAIVKIIPQLNMHNSKGLYHFCSDEPCSWYDFAIEIFNQAKIKNFKTPKIIKSIETNTYPSLVKRPAYSVLDSSKIKDCFGVNAPNWRIGITSSLSKLKP